MVIACKRPPEYPKTPEISFKSINKQKVQQKRGPGFFVTIDSVTISLNFKDGDGDLGRSDDTENYFCRVLMKQNDIFKDILVIDTLTKKSVPIPKNGRFFPLNIDGRQGPIEGVLNFGPSLNFVAYVPDSVVDYTLKFQIYIKDNAGNQSNVVESTPVLVKLY